MQWEQLQGQCESCRGCGLCKTRNRVVFGVGRKDADILFIGEAPGEQEDLQGEPFVGAAGKLLDEMLSIIDLNRENIYIANIVKCRPPMNRNPSEEEQDACIPFLEEQIRLINPKIIVCLGAVAAKRIIYPDYKISREHGSWICKDGVWITSMLHPSALLRDVHKRPDAFEDLIFIRKKLKEVRAKL